MRQINKIYVHCSATPPDMDIGVAEINKWHLARGWNMIGYHKVIRRDGTCERGRSDSIIGAHARGHNSDSLAICLVGGKDRFDFTLSQIYTLLKEVTNWCIEYDLTYGDVVSHWEVSAKACPQFDARRLFTNLNLIEVARGFNIVIGES